MLNICRQLLSIIYIYAVVKEWNAGGEFKDTEKIIVVGSQIQALLVRVFLIKISVLVSYCNLNFFDHMYKCRKNVKWIVFDNRKAKYLKSTGTDILIFPIL